MRRVLVVLAAASAITLSMSLVRAFPARAATTSIEVGNLYFCSASFSGSVCETTVNAGDTVTWSDVGGFHTVTECDDSFSTCPPAGGFDSGTLEPGDSFSHTFTSAGVFEYHCTFHPSAMRGRITVQAATPTPTAAPTPTPSGTAVAPTSTPTAGATPAGVPRAGGKPEGGADAGLDGWLLVFAGAALLAVAGFAASTAMRRAR